MTSGFPCTDRTLAVFGLVGQSARQAVITPTDLAVALLDLPDGNAPTWWRSRGFDPIRAIAALRPDATVRESRDDIRPDRACKDVIRAAAILASRAGARHLGTEHLLSALLRDPTVREAFAAQGITPALAAAHVQDLAGHPGVEQPQVILTGKELRLWQLMNRTGPSRRGSVLTGAIGITLLLILALCLVGPIFF